MTARLLKIGRVPSDRPLSLGRLLACAVLVIAASTALSQSVQSPPNSETEVAKTSKPASDGTPGNSNTSAAASTANPASAGANANADPGSAPATRAEFEALEKRIEQLETELKQERARNLADTDTTSALKNAEKELLGGAPANASTGSTAPAPSSAGASPVEKQATTAPQAPAAKDPHAPAFTDWDWT